jgi:hypothetical protein
MATRSAQPTALRLVQPTAMRLAKPMAHRLARTSGLSTDLASGLVSDPSWATKLARRLEWECTLEAQALALPSARMMART